MPKPVILILGFGNNIGANVASRFAQAGFDVAVVCRKIEKECILPEYLAIKKDLREAEGLAAVFEEVESAYGPPAVVVYNVAQGVFARPGEPLSLQYSDIVNDATTTGLNAFEAARLANEAFNKLPANQSRVFIATGNQLVTQNIPHLIGLSIGKRALANIIEACATAYGDSGKRFYYASEDTGGESIPPHGPSHGRVYYHLYRQETQGKWSVRFRKGGTILEAVSPDTSMSPASPASIPTAGV